MDDKLMYILNNDIQNYPFCSNLLVKNNQTQFNKSTQSLLLTDKIMGLKRLGTSIIYSSTIPSLPGHNKVKNNVKKFQGRGVQCQSTFCHLIA